MPLQKSDRSPLSIPHDIQPLILRIGLGLVFIIGGWNKLYQLLNPALEAGILASYLGPAGYINSFFQDFLFTGTLGSLITPWGFLTALSTFEFVSGLMLLAGLFIRPLAMLYAALLWTFVLALPVVTTPGIVPDGNHYASPAMLVQIRDIALSLLFVVLYLKGPGKPSVDARFNLFPAGKAEWKDTAGLLLRAGLGLALLVGGVFAGFDHIQDFALPPVFLMGLGLLLLAGIYVRAAALMAGLGLVYYLLSSLNPDASLIANLNGIKREIALIAGALLLAAHGGGRYFTLPRAVRTLRTLGRAAG